MPTALTLVLVSLLSFPGLAAHAAGVVTQSGAAARALTVVSSGPTGEIAALADASEIRIVFSEPMVTLGRIPAAVRPPFVHIAPAAAGSFRWSGTTILIFTPDPKKPLPFATRYEVTVDAGAAAVSGRTLASAVHVQLHHADGEAAGDALVSPRRSRRRADGDAPALQSARSRR